MSDLTGPDFKALDFTAKDPDFAARVRKSFDAQGLRIA